MRIAAMILGIIGGLLGLSASYFVLFINNISFTINNLKIPGNIEIEIIKLNLKISNVKAAIICSLAALISASITLKKPILSGGILLISALVGMLCISGWYFPAYILITTAGIFAFQGINEIERK